MKRICRKRLVGYAAWVMGCVLLYFFENGTVTRCLLLLSLVLPFLSILEAAWAALRVHVDLKMAERLHTGEEPHLVLTVARLPLWLFCAVRGRVRAENRLTGEWKTRKFPIGKRQELTFPPVHAGSFVCTLEETVISDGFGLVSFPAIVPEPLCVPVYPDSITVHWEPKAAGETGESTVRAGQGQEWMDGEIRDYVPGDPMNRMHWKLSARMDAPLVREPQAPGLCGTLMVFYHPQGEGTPETVESALAAFLSSAQEGLGLAGLTLAWQDGEETRWVEEPTGSLEEAVLLSLPGTGEIGADLSILSAQRRFDEVLLFTPCDAGDTAAQLLALGRGECCVIATGETGQSLPAGAREIRMEGNRLII
ncbi:MAG: DUF58 domain-containing protein [Clostridia bacterium]|nr:DUF58 domain-containing protein [Clostridia bacterium]